jgi:hypothetical protein
VAENAPGARAAGARADSDDGSDKDEEEEAADDDHGAMGGINWVRCEIPEVTTTTRQVRTRSGIKGVFEKSWLLPPFNGPEAGINKSALPRDSQNHITVD